MKKTWVLSALLILLVVCAFVWGCARKEKKVEGAVLATVDGEAVTANDIAAADTSFCVVGGRLIGSVKEANKLDLVIERKALLHEAMKLNLHKDPEFLRAIQKYWEFTLLSKMLDLKKKEIERTVNIDDRELDDYIHNMCYSFKYRQSVFKDRAEAEAFAARCSSQKGVEPAEVVNVSACEGISPAVSDEIFQMKTDDLKVIKKGGGFIVVKMLSKNRVLNPREIPPKDEIKRYALEMKRAEALDEWIASVVNGAKVERTTSKVKP